MTPRDMADETADLVLDHLTMVRRGLTIKNNTKSTKRKNKSKKVEI